MSLKGKFLSFLGNELGVPLSGICTAEDYSQAQKSAILDVKSSNQGFLLPRMTNAERDGINQPAMGLLIFNTEEFSLQVFDGEFWRPVTMGPCFLQSPGSIAGNTTPYENTMGELYSISPVSGASSYTWTVPPGSTIASGQGTTSITVNFGLTDGNVSVRAENYCGVSSFTDLAVSLVPPPTCNDLVQNGNETDIDCGGPDCDPCSTGSTCAVDSDCESGVCVGGICQEPTCTDGVQNSDETDIDCGGAVCGPCNSGSTCAVDLDCESGVCVGGICQEPTCSDGVQNGNETGVDCGGPDCDPC